MKKERLKRYGRAGAGLAGETAVVSYGDYRRTRAKSYPGQSTKVDKAVGAANLYVAGKTYKSAKRFNRASKAVNVKATSGVGRKALAGAKKSGLKGAAVAGVVGVGAIGYTGASLIARRKPTYDRVVEGKRQKVKNPHYSQSSMERKQQMMHG